MDDDHLKIGIPDDEAATAPRQQFRSGAAERVQRLKGFTPALLMALGLFGGKLFAPDEARSEIPQGRARPEPDSVPPRAPGKDSAPARGAPGVAQGRGENVVPFPDPRPRGGPPPEGPGDLSASVSATVSATVSAEDDTFFFFGPSSPGGIGGGSAGGALGDDAPSMPILERGAGEPGLFDRLKPLRFSKARADDETLLLAAAAALMAGASQFGAVAADPALAMARGEFDQGAPGPAPEAPAETPVAETGQEAPDTVTDAEPDPAPVPVYTRGTERDDRIDGTGADDVIDAGSGADLVDAQGGDDVIFGGAGGDDLQGGAGDDILIGGPGDDLMHGDEGDDVLFGGAGNDRLYGDAGNDTLQGGTGDDLLSGGEGDDLLDGGAGADHIEGGAGNDRVVLASATDAAGDSYDGGGGTDTLDLSALETGVTVNLHDGTLDVTAGTDVDRGEGNSAFTAVEGVASVTLTSIENVVCGAGQDVIVASAEVNVLTGGAGADRFVFADAASLGNAGHGIDLITDFEVGDLIDLSQIRILGQAMAELKLFFLENAPEALPDLGAVYALRETGEDAAEVTYVHAWLGQEENGQSGDGQDGNGQDGGDYEIALSGGHDLTARDFVFDHHFA